MPTQSPVNPQLSVAMVKQQIGTGKATSLFSDPFAEDDLVDEYSHYKEGKTLADSF